MKRREFLRGLLIATLAAPSGQFALDGSVGHLCTIEKDVTEAVKAQIGSNKFEPQSVIVDQSTYCKYFKITKEMLDDEEMFNELMDEAGVPDQRPDEVKIGYVDDDFEDNLLTVVLKYKSI